MTERAQAYHGDRARAPHVDQPYGEQDGERGDDVEFRSDDVFSRFSFNEKIGEGTFGEVYRVSERSTGKIFAIKKIRIHLGDDGFGSPGEGVPTTAIREISVLKECNHPNIIKLHEVLHILDRGVPKALYLLFDSLDMDLRRYLRNPKYGKFADRWQLVSVAHQCTSAVEYCHTHRITHRDLKTQNVLIDVASGRIKLADFGLARPFTVPLKPYTREVVTVWYRSPELLMGQRTYSSQIDIWSLGCIYAELATGDAIFRGDSEIGTLMKIMQVLGTPTDEVWRGVATLANFSKEFPVWRGDDFRSLREEAPALGTDGINLVRACLHYNPVDRWSASALLEHPFFCGRSDGGRSNCGRSDRASRRSTGSRGGPAAPRREHQVEQPRAAEYQVSRDKAFCLVCYRTWTLPEPRGGICPVDHAEVMLCSGVEPPWPALNTNFV